MGKKSKHVSEEAEAGDEDTELTSPTKEKNGFEKRSYEELLNHVSVIANPMASKKLTKKIYKLLKKGNVSYFNVDFLSLRRFFSSLISC